MPVHAMPAVIVGQSRGDSGDTARDRALRARTAYEGAASVPHRRRRLFLKSSTSNACRAWRYRTDGCTIAALSRL